MTGGGGQHLQSDDKPHLGLLSEPLIVEQAEAESAGRPHSLQLLGVSVLAYNRTLLRVVLYSYNNLSLALVSFFHCQQLDAAHGRRMYSYPSISCSSGVYLRLLPAFVVGLILVPLGFPMMLFLLLLRHRRQQSRRTPALSAGEASAQELASRTAYARYGMLYASYRDECWYWSCVVLLQRMTLIIVFVFVPSPASFHWLTAINLSILTTHLLVRPYRSRRDNVLEAGLLFLLGLQTSLLPLYPPALVNNTLAALVSAVIILPAVLLQLALWLAQKPRVRAVAASSTAWLQQRTSQMRLRLPVLLSRAGSRSALSHPADSSSSNEDDEL
jgi:hypothetical protein